MATGCARTTAAATSPARDRRQGGFSLLEVLITVVIVSIGLLGLAGLQARALQNNTAAYHRSQATLLANDMADRIRANPVGYSDGDYDGLDARASSSISDPGCAATGCSAAQMAQYDGWRWKQDLAATLPLGQGYVCVDGSAADPAGTAKPVNRLDDGTPADPKCSGAADGVLTVKIWWDGARKDGTVCIRTTRDGVVDDCDPRVVLSVQP